VKIDNYRQLEINLSLCLNTKSWRHTGGLKLFLFLILALDGTEWSASRFWHFNPDTRLILGWVGSRGILDVMAKWDVFVPPANRHTAHPVTLLPELTQPINFTSLPGQWFNWHRLLSFLFECMQKSVSVTFVWNVLCVSLLYWVENCKILEKWQEFLFVFFIAWSVVVEWKVSDQWE
jgi:hypothetical protein